MLEIADKMGLVEVPAFIGDRSERLIVPADELEAKLEPGDLVIYFGRETGMLVDELLEIARCYVVVGCNPA